MLDVDHTPLPNVLVITPQPFDAGTHTSLLKTGNVLRTSTKHKVQQSDCAERRKRARKFSKDESGKHLSGPL